MDQYLLGIYIGSASNLAASCSMGMLWCEMWIGRFARTTTATSGLGVRHTMSGSPALSIFEEHIHTSCADVADLVSPRRRGN